MHPLDKYTAKLASTGGEVKNNLRWDWYEMEITELHSIGSLVFENPLKLDISVEIDVTTNVPQTANVIYDFGLEYRIALRKENNFLYNYASPNHGLDPMQTALSTIKFDLMHAFFHYKGDPNYAHLHWALYGNLKSRVISKEYLPYE